MGTFNCDIDVRNSLFVITYKRQPLKKVHDVMLLQTSTKEIDIKTDLVFL